MEYKTQIINGTKYAYLDTPIWNSVKKRGEHKRNYIGKVIDGQFVPNKKYLFQKQCEEQESNRKPDRMTVMNCTRQFYGATYLLDQIAERIGIAADLKACFGTLSAELLSIAYYLVLEEGQPIYRFQKWGCTHWHPHATDIPSQQISEILNLITEEKKLDYFRRQARRRTEKEYLAFDTTSISSYSELLKQAKYEKNKEGDALPQIHLVVLYGERSLLPVYYRELPSNGTDAKANEYLIKDINFLQLGKSNLVMDCGFYSEKHVNDMMKYCHAFLLGVRISPKLVSSCLNQAREDFLTRTHYNSKLHLYIGSFTANWKYTAKKPQLEEMMKEKCRLYIYIYFNDQYCTDDRDRFNPMLDRYEEEVRHGTRKVEHEQVYAKDFNLHETPARSLQISHKEDVILQAEKGYGYFALMSNEIKDPVKALENYRLRDLIEKSFGNLKERLDIRRMSGSSERNFEGKLFVQFVALELMSYIKKRMDENDLFRNYTIQSLLDELDIIEFYQQPGNAHYLSEITNKQHRLYELMGIQSPS